MKKFWEKMALCESEDGTWEIIHNSSEERVRLFFMDYTDQGTPQEVLKKMVELELTYDQFQSLLDFSKRMNVKVKE